MNVILNSLRLLDKSGRRRMILLVFMVLINSLFEVASITLILPFIGFATAPETLMARDEVMAIATFIGVTDSRELLVIMGITLVVVFLAKNAYAYLLTAMQWRFVYGQITTLSSRLFRRYLASPYRYHLSRNTSSMISMLDGVVDTIFIKILLGTLQLATEMLVVAGLIILMLIVKPMVILPVAAAAGIVAILALRSVQQKLYNLGSQEVGYRMKRLRALRQGFDILRESKVLRCEEFFANTFQSIRSEHAEKQAVVGVLGQTPRLIIEAVLFSSLVVAVLVAFLQTSTSAEILPLLALIGVSALRILPSITRIITAITGIRHGAAASKMVFDDIQNLPQLETTDTTQEPENPVHFRDTLRLEKVVLKYGEDDQAALDGISISVRQGEMIGVVGHSGAGKSSLVNILLGLLPPDSGRFEVDGKSVPGNERGWQGQIGYVPQQVVLIDGDVNENVALGIEAENIDEAAVWRALKLASLSDFIRDLPDGLKTSLGEQGGRLSGGQRQRIGIARALYHDPDLLILDEATASLDKVTEDAIAQSIEGLRGKKTIIIIAHNFRVVENCDRLYVLDEGCVVDQGTFTDLSERSAKFQDLARLTNEQDTDDTRTTQLDKSDA